MKFNVINKTIRTTVQVLQLLIFLFQLVKKEGKKRSVSKKEKKKEKYRKAKKNYTRSFFIKP